MGRFTSGKPRNLRTENRQLGTGFLTATCRPSLYKNAKMGQPRNVKSRGYYRSFAYSALACLRIGISGSASFQIVRKS
jgi:hypothetical protein